MVVKAVKSKCCTFCKSKAGFSLKFRKMGVIFNIRLCSPCIKKLYAEIGRVMIPKSLKEPFNVEKEGYEEK